jgi:hypothetical protein
MMEYETPKRIKALANSKRTEEIAAQVLQLQTSDKFRLAAELLDLGKPEVAEAVGTRACQEIQLSQLFMEKHK